MMESTRLVAKISRVGYFVLGVRFTRSVFSLYIKMFHFSNPKLGGFMHFNRLVLFAVISILLLSCSEDTVDQSATASAPQSSVTSESPQATTNQKKIPAATSAGNVTVNIVPENPTASDCLRAVVQGSPGRSAVVWDVNGQTVSSGTDAQLCNAGFKRDDLVTVTVGTSDIGAQASVSIINSLPRVVDISSTPSEIFAGVEISVSPVAEDADGDEVDFTYQWLINGEADPVLTESILPGDRIRKGDSIQVLIVPNDFFDDGPTYESYATSVPNAAPSIISQPPQEILSRDYQYQVVASDPDDTEFTFRLDEAPEGMTIDEKSGLIQWSLMEVTPGDYTIAIVVADQEGAESAQEYRLTLGESQ
jgi:hypothetical protein